MSELYTVPALPVPRTNNIRQRGEETPSHPGGLSETARKKLEERRRNRDKQRGTCLHMCPARLRHLLICSPHPEGIAAQNQRRDDAPRGLGEFQGRLNRDRGYDRNGRSRDGDRYGKRGWEATPRSERGRPGEDAPSVRVPNVGWDSTPRRSEDGHGWGSSKNRRWDAPTPRASRGGSPETDGERTWALDVREWEEEQIRLDRDWYTGAEEGGLAGDEDYNPLAQYDDLGAIKQAELVTRQVVSTLLTYQRVSRLLFYRRKFLRDRLSM